MGNRGISFGFGFLNQEASFDITFSMIEYDGSHSYGRAFLVGLLNTILVSAIGIFFATIMGVIVGISRLSDNYLIQAHVRPLDEGPRSVWRRPTMDRSPLPTEPAEAARVCDNLPVHA